MVSATAVINKKLEVSVEGPEEKTTQTKTNYIAHTHAHFSVSQTLNGLVLAFLQTTSEKEVGSLTKPSTDNWT